MSNKQYPSDRRYDELDAMARRAENEQVVPVEINTPGVDTRKVQNPAPIYASLFGDSPSTQQAAAQRDSMYQSWLNTRKKSAEQQRTDDAKMARYNALGNLLTTMVQPVGWAVGGKVNGANTGGVQTYDQRQYLEAFNRAVRDSQELRNIGTQKAEYDFKIADENYRRALARDDQMRNFAIKQAQLETQAQQKLDYEKQRQADELEKIEARGDVQKWLAEYKAAHRVTGRGGLSVDDRALIAARNNYEQYRRTRATQGLEPMSFEQYMKGEGYNVQDTAKAPSSTAKSAGQTGKTGGFKTGKTTQTTTTTNTNTGKKGGFRL